MSLGRMSKPQLEDLEFSIKPQDLSSFKTKTIIQDSVPNSHFMWRFTNIRILIFIGRNDDPLSNPTLLGCPLYSIKTDGWK